jgi:hypothetical protein
MAQASQSTFNTHLASFETLDDKAAAGPGATNTSLATYDNAPPNVPNTDSSSQETRRGEEADAPVAATQEEGKGAPPAGGPPGGDFGAAHGGRSKGKIALIMSALCMAVFLAALDVTIITTALPTISGKSGIVLDARSG